MSDHDAETPAEVLADWLGAMPESHNVFDITDEATTVISIDVETLAERVAARIVQARAGEDGDAAAPKGGPWVAFPGKVPVCRDCGADWQPVRRGECIKCGSDAGPLHNNTTANPECTCLTRPRGNCARHGFHNSATLEREGLGGALDTLLRQNWPNCGVNPWYLADLLREARAGEGALRERIEALLPNECWISQATTVHCADYMGGTFPNGAEFTEDMCCLPCRLRAALTDTAGDPT